MIVASKRSENPTSINAYTDARYNGKAVIANALFGTTTAHTAALFTVWGDQRASDFLDDMHSNGAPSLISALCVILVVATLGSLTVLGSLFNSVRSRR